jgi:hypothetical protein
MRAGYSAKKRNGLDPDNDNPAPGHPATGTTGRPLADHPTLTIFLRALNGERFVAEQLASLEWQTYTGWRLVASDDGSTDGTLAILRAFRDSHLPGNVEIIEGPQRGAPASRQHPVSDYCAFCDQDDVWEPNKLARAIAILAQAPRDVPVLYSPRTGLIDARGKKIGLSPPFPRKPTFRSALVQSIAGGHTMLWQGILMSGPQSASRPRAIRLKTRAVPSDVCLQRHAPLRSHSIGALSPARERRFLR